MPTPWVPTKRWMPIGQYRNIPLPIKPLIELKRSKSNKVKVK